MSVSLSIQQQAGEIARAKAAAKECLVAADKYLKARLFEKARAEVEKAKSIDPANPYISAFEERINLFEIQVRESSAKEAQPEKKPEPPKPPATDFVKPPPFKPEPEPLKKSAPPPAPPKQQAPTPKPAFSPPPPPPQTENQEELKGKIDEMSKQIAELTQALLVEKRNREEIQKKQLETGIRQFRLALEKAWALGAPKDAEQEKLSAMARSLNIDPEIEVSIQREVKIQMYAKAVKDVLAKRKLLRSSSNTLEWLRKVYQVSMTEYLEYESKFLLDLVTDQFRGTMLIVAADDGYRREITQRMKTSGFAVVAVSSAEEALEKIEKVSPTFVMCEPELPTGRISGLMFLQLLRSNPKFSFLPFIFLCTDTDIELVSKSELRVNEGAVLKSVDLDELNAIINEKLAHLRNYISSL